MVIEISQTTIPIIILNFAIDNMGTGNIDFETANDPQNTFNVSFNNKRVSLIVDTVSKNVEILSIN